MCSVRDLLPSLSLSTFSVPFCRLHARNIFPLIKRELIEPGVVRYVLLHYPLESVHPSAPEASEAAECAGVQGRLWDMHERLFASVETLTRMNAMRLARVLKLDEVAFEQCLEKDQTLGKIREDREAGLRLDVTGTPTFFIGSVRPDGSLELIARIRGATTLDVFAREAKAARLHVRGDPVTDVSDSQPTRLIWSRTQ